MINLKTHLTILDSQHKAWKMIGLHSLCAVMFTVGFALREYSSYHYIDQGNALIIYIMSQVFINVCP